MSNNEKIKYSQVVSAVVEDNSYFKDALDWYCIKYLSIAAERTYFILLSVMSFFIILFLYFTIKNILPLKESFPILIKRDNTVDYYTKISPIKPENIKYTSNEAILRFLLIKYTRELFTHNYKNGSMEDLNTKLTKIKNYSSNDVYQKFRNDFNKISADMFNKNVNQIVNIKTFSFIKDDKLKKGTINKIKKYVFNVVPTEAEIRYSTIFTNEYGEKKVSDEKILLTFKYETIKYNNIRKEFTKPVLTIIGYNIIKE